MSAKDQIKKDEERNELLEFVSNVIKEHTLETFNRIDNHLDQVKRTTGQIELEDVSYVLSLSNRELLAKIKNL